MTLKKPSKDKLRMTPSAKPDQTRARNQAISPDALRTIMASWETHRVEIKRACQRVLNLRG